MLRVRYKARIVRTDSGSQYRAVIKLPRTGTWRVRAEHRDKGHAKTYSHSTRIKVTNWRKRYWGKKLGGFTTAPKLVAITIDDGPNRRTMEICRILERYGAKGTFFFTNHLLKGHYEDQARRAYDRGHEIANHTAHHEMLWGSYRFCYSEAYATIPTIRRATGYRPNWIRAMGGGIGPTGMRAVVDTKQLYCNWSIDSYDSHHRWSAAEHHLPQRGRSRAPRRRDTHPPDAPGERCGPAEDLRRAEAPGLQGGHALGVCRAQPSALTRHTCADTLSLVSRRVA